MVRSSHHLPTSFDRVSWRYLKCSTRYSPFQYKFIYDFIEFLNFQGWPFSYLSADSPGAPDGGAQNRLTIADAAA